MAAELEATPTQVAPAWLLARSPVVLPIPGTARIDHLEENAAAGHVRPTPAHLDVLDRLAAPEQGPAGAGVRRRRRTSAARWRTAGPPLSAPPDGRTR
ncbi:aldo/keto reductase [Streptomyces sp. NPDC006175]|uniref:aldo/keto reductase n=1 Tax=unclassified Streptomyces TaxID=2593676 RepID=UPI0033B89D29